MRSARSEHPDRRLRLVDLDPGIEATGEVLSALALDGEPSLAVRGERWLALRLVSVRADHVERATPVRLGGVPTVLVTGGVGELGRMVARHLVVVHGVRHLLLTSRRGMDAPDFCGAYRDAAGAWRQTVSVVACDVADRTALAGVLGSIPATARLGRYSILPECLTTARSPH